VGVSGASDLAGFQGVLGDFSNLISSFSHDRRPGRPQRARRTFDSLSLTVAHVA
jgi:hypothetical protein